MPAWLSVERSESHVLWTLMSVMSGTELPGRGERKGEGRNGWRGSGRQTPAQVCQWWLRMHGLFDDSPPFYLSHPFVYLDAHSKRSCDCAVIWLRTHTPHAADMMWKHGLFIERVAIKRLETVSNSSLWEFTANCVSVFGYSRKTRDTQDAVLSAVFSGGNQASTLFAKEWNTLLLPMLYANSFKGKVIFHPTCLLCVMLLAKALVI